MDTSSSRHHIYDLDDFRLTLKELKVIIDNLIEQHSEDTTIYPDAGYNNVSFYLIKE